MKYIHVSADDGSIDVTDQLDPEWPVFEGWAIMVPNDFVLNIPVDKMSDPYVYEYLLESKDRNLMRLPRWTETRGVGSEIRLMMTENVNQYDDQPIDTVDEVLRRIYGEKACIDWRDEGECWIWPNGYPTPHRGQEVQIQPVDPPEDLHPTREQVEQHAFEDFTRLRSKGHSLKDLVLADLEAHEFICDMIEAKHKGH